ncbi:hypothetical protein HMF8227_02396 [Saliniradius amylolyticus]|uniref:DUF350 domain-containing protein n=2 Tax=Saliniradius amylolyticus TaxID=2183582 RepID=A0A2S2E5B4_9ALTE|nr:hypothetical protein HMF8227_02396 [Saliniradius amylolyticus]
MLDHQTLLYLGLDVVIAIALLALMRWAYELWSSIDSDDQLAGKDNFAYGISIAGSLLALSIVLWSAAERASGDDYLSRAMQMLVYGLVGFVLIKVGRWAHDRLILNRFNKRDEILKKNISVALVDAASSLATALIIRSVLLWSEGFNINSGIAIITGFVIALAVMLVTTRLMERRFARDNQNDSMQDTLVLGQLALAVQHGGYLIGTAFAATAASHMLTYQGQAYITNLLVWLGVGVLFTLLTVMLSRLTKAFILRGIDCAKEVDHQHNVGVASIDASLTIGMALILSGLIA